jgi:hypothetical protein
MLLSSRRGAFAVIVIIWLLSRIYPLWMMQPIAYDEIWFPQKLLDYGFFERHGALLQIDVAAGILNHPESFNYTSHPYPPFWLNTLLLYLCGKWAIFSFWATIQILACLFLYEILKKKFDEKIALVSTLLFVLSPVAIYYSVDPNTVAIGSLFWIFTFYAVLFRNLKLLAVSIFLAVQISWLALSFIPCLFLYLFLEPKFDSGYRKAAARVLILAGGISLALFVVQIAFFAPNAKDIWGTLHSRGVSSSLGLIDRLGLYRIIFLKIPILLGPAIAGGALLFLVSKKWDGFLAANASYFVIFLGVSLLLTPFFASERNMYPYLTFPAVALVGGLLQRWPTQSVRAILLSLGVIGFAYSQIQVSIPKISQTSVQIGKEISSRTNPKTLVLTNFQKQKPPFPHWDVGMSAASFLRPEPPIEFYVLT